jgi:hypothetical protein
MKSFSEWLVERNAMQENMADYTPRFIRKPLQNMGLMGQTTREIEDDEQWIRQQAIDDKYSRQPARQEYQPAKKKDSMPAIGRNPMSYSPEEREAAAREESIRKGERSYVFNGQWKSNNPKQDRRDQERDDDLAMATREFGGFRRS